jgi:M-phase inducer tyrosine phosphatase
VLDGDLHDRFDQVIVLDCRFHYEFEAGHIIHATNLLTRRRLHQIYDDNIGRHVCIVFHCELSVNRGPTWASLFRELDRARTGCYGRTDGLNYRDVFILEGGYRRFHSEYPGLIRRGYHRIEDNELGELTRCQRLYEKETGPRWHARTPVASPRFDVTNFPEIRFESLTYSSSQTTL